VKSHSDAGGQILFGTDIGYITVSRFLYEGLRVARSRRPDLSAGSGGSHHRDCPAVGFGTAAGRVADSQDAALVILEQRVGNSKRALSTSACNSERDFGYGDGLFKQRNSRVVRAVV